MKKYLNSGWMFVSGMMAGVMVVSLFSFTSAPSSPAGGLTPVSVEVANTMFRNYMADAAPLTAVLKGFTVNREQLEAMNNILRENTGLAGFRVYMGKDNAAKPILLVVGVDNAGKDAVKNSIFTTESLISGPCPTVCDATSPIIQQK